MKFSERLGFKPIKLEIQDKSIDDALRSGLWTALKLTLFDFHRSYGTWEDRATVVAQRTFIHFYKLPIDATPEDPEEFVSGVRKWFFDATWNEVYDFVEFCADVEYLNSGWAYEGEERSERMRNFANDFLEREHSAYRFVGLTISKITDQSEIDDVNEAAAATDQFAAASKHIQTAIMHFSNRKQPDFRNSIKEAISAVESCARVIAGQNKATLADAIKAIEKTHGMHPALKEGLLKIYGYTSDGSGIRHAMIEVEGVDATDAKFMLVSCSAFCNYLKARYSPKN